MITADSHGLAQGGSRMSCSGRAAWSAVPSSDQFVTVTGRYVPFDSANSAMTRMPVASVASPQASLAGCGTTE